MASGWKALIAAAALLVAGFGPAAHAQPEEPDAAPAEKLTPAQECAALPDCKILPAVDAFAAPEDPEEAARPEYLDAAAKARRLADSCERGNAADCHLLGLAFGNDGGVRSSPAIAAELFDQACREGIGAACSDLAQSLGFVAKAGQGNPRIEQALERGCQLDDTRSCSFLAELLFAQKGPPAALDRAAALARRSCERGDAVACETLIENLAAAPSVRRAAAELYGERCDRQIAGACTQAALALDPAAAEDAARADRLLQRGCELREARGCYQLAANALAPPDQPGGRARAMVFMEQACAIDASFCGDVDTLRSEPALAQQCQASDGEACVKLGQTYAFSVLQNLSRATQAFRKACDIGNPAGCARFADFVLPRRGEPSSAEIPAAIAALERGCELGSADVCEQLAGQLIDGKFVTADPLRAGRLLDGLCKQAIDQACTRLATLAGLVPEAPPIVVDASFGPPDEAGAQRTGRRTARKRACKLVTVRFRGKDYQHLKCGPQYTSLGGFAAGANDAPWQALLERPAQLNGQAVTGTYRVACGGSLIAPGWVLTAAHCIYDQGADIAGAGYRIRLGVYHSQASEGFSYPILRTVKHDRYDPKDKLQRWDIALIRYAADQPLKRGPTGPVGRIRLDPKPLQKRAIMAGMPVYSFGWGWTQARNSRATNELRGVRMLLSAPTSCSRETGFTGALTATLLCAAGSGNAQSCKGDSGGPLVYYGDPDKVPTLIGVVSAGVECGAQGNTSRFTRVAAARDWIDRTIGAAAAR